MPLSSSFRIISVISIYWIVSWQAIFLNKYIYSHMNSEISAPYFITLLQFVAPTVLLYIISFINKHLSLSKDFPDLKFSFNTAKNVFPISILFCATVTLSNLCLKYVEVSFYQISRSLGIPMIPIINYLLFGERSTWQTFFSCFIIVIGYILGIEGELQLSIKGTALGILASLIGIFYTIFVQRYLKASYNNNWELCYYNNLNSCLIMPFISFLNGEFSIIEKHKNEITLSYLLWISLAGIIGLVVGLATQYQIKYTSSLSHNISGVVKNCIQSFIGASIYHTTLTTKSILGLFMILVGSINYAIERININSSIDAKKVQCIYINDIENRSCDA